MVGYPHELLVLRDADEAIDQQQLVLVVGALQPGWQELKPYSGPLPPQAVRALESASAWPAHHRMRNSQ